MNILQYGLDTFDNEISALTAARDSLNGEFVKAVEALCSAKKIILSGVGKSGLIGQKIAATLTSIGLMAYSIHPVDALHGDIGIIRSGDVVIMLSKSGSTDEIVRLMPFVKSRGATAISIVSERDSYLAVNADITLITPIEREACPLNIVPTSSTTAALALGDALAVAVMKVKNITIQDFSRQHPLGQIGRNITLRVSDLMHKGEAVPKVLEGELFKNALIEMSNKKLGCVCICDSDDTLKGIITDGDVRRILVKHNDLKDLRVDELMTLNPAHTSGDVFLGEALSEMSSRQSQISVLPVIDDNMKLLGVIRVHDIIRSGI